MFCDAPLFLTRLFLCETGSEFLDSANLVHDFFLARIERMARGTHLHFYEFFGRPNGEGIAASARHLGFGIVSWMDILFHNILTIA